MRQKSVILSPAEKKAAAKTLKAEIAVLKKDVKTNDTALKAAKKNFDAQVKSIDRTRANTVKVLGKLEAHLGTLVAAPQTTSAHSGY